MQDAGYSYFWRSSANCRAKAKSIATKENWLSVLPPPRPKDCPAGSYPLRLGELLPNMTGLRPGDCVLCPAGTEKPNKGLHYCTACDPGYASVAAGAALCTICEAGTMARLPEKAVQVYASGVKQDLGSIACDKCSPGSYSEPRATTCIQCAPGTGSVADGSECRPCNEGTYLMNGVCEPCSVNQVSSPLPGKKQRRR